MLKSKSIKNRTFMVIMATFLVAVAIIATCFGSINTVFAEEVSPTNDITPKSVYQTNIYVPAIGTFKEGNRQYGGYTVCLEVERHGSSFTIKYDVGFVTQDYKTDRYYVESFSFYFFGSGLTENREARTTNVGCSAGTISYDYLTKGFFGVKVTCSGKKANNHPVAQGTIEMKANNSTPNIGIAVDNVNIVGIALAKDTKISNQTFVSLEIPFVNDFATISPTYRYMPTYNGKSLIVNAQYASWGGPIPSNWTAPIGNL